MTLALLLPLALYAAMSAITVAAYAIDKRRAAHGGRRLRERSLHLLELLGGWPGALLAQRTLRHKNAKASYQMVFWLIVIVHLGLWVAAARLAWRC